MNRCFDCEGRPVIVILAAGQSRRFGAPKLLQPMPDGRPLLAHTLDRASAVAVPCLLVIDEAQPALQQCATEANVFPLPVNTAGQGMGASLALAVKAASRAQGWLVMLGDMPAIRVSTLRRILASANANTIVTPWCDGRRGHPVWFGQRFFNELCCLDGDQGGRQILQDHTEALIRLDLDDPGIHWDVDTPAQLAQWQAQLP